MAGWQKDYTVDATQPSGPCSVGGIRRGGLAKRGDGLSWREWALKEWPMDPEIASTAVSATRLQACDSTQLGTLWTVPFILSWSLMETMAVAAASLVNTTS